LAIRLHQRTATGRDCPATPAGCQGKSGGKKPPEVGVHELRVGSEGGRGADLASLPGLVTPDARGHQGLGRWTISGMSVVWSLPASAGRPGPVKFTMNWATSLCNASKSLRAESRCFGCS